MSRGARLRPEVTGDSRLARTRERFLTMPPELGAGVRQAAARQGTSVSTWLTEAAADKLRNELLGAALDQWEAEDGSFTQTELDEAASRLGLAPRSDVA